MPTVQDTASMSSRAYLQVDFRLAPPGDVPHAGKHLDQKEAEALHLLLARLTPAQCEEIAGSALQGHLIRQACDKLLAGLERTLQPSPIRSVPTKD